ncbi:MAG TPA: efflux RND transporter periplasmic adaptor subunit [Candidatus Acidoferrales bacterium]|jgi:HlyD family secretion protein|nr:efflux RND transporter periplasmic adaptor subunit [Candidatus Acidoferrales bacterium]
MKTNLKPFILIGAIFVIALVAYLVTTPHGDAIPLTGIVDGNEVIVSPQIMGRIVNLTVDEGSEVKKGQLIAELDPKELEASLDAAKANVASLEAQVHEANHNFTWTDDQTGASLKQAEATLTSQRAQLDQAKASLWRDQTDFKRMQGLFNAGVESAQDRDHAEATLRVSEANVKSLEDSVNAQAAALDVAQANRKQVDVRQSEIATTIAQLEQARASEAETATQLGYTKIYAPIDGIVSVRVAKQGEVVAQGSPIVVVVDVDHLWVRADVEESYIDSVQFGQILQVRLPSGRIIEGPVFFKGVENDFATQRDVSRTKRDIKTFAIKVSVPNDGRRLFTGMTATVLLPPPPTKNWFARL